MRISQACLEHIKCSLYSLLNQKHFAYCPDVHKGRRIQTPSKQVYFCLEMSDVIKQTASWIQNHIQGIMLENPDQLVQISIPEPVFQYDPQAKAMSLFFEFKLTTSQKEC